MNIGKIGKGLAGALLFGAFAFWSPGQVQAEFEEVLSKIHPYLTVQEEYTDNLYLSSANTKEDWITTVYPGIRISTLPEKTGGPTGIPDPWGIDFNYRMGLVFYANNEDLNYISHQGTLNTWYNVGPKLGLRLREYFIRSQEPLERSYAADAQPNQYILGTQRDRSIYYRNVVEPGITYKYGKEDSLDFLYRNNIYRTENPTGEDSQENSVNTRLTHWFNIRNGIFLEYGLTLGEFERSPDFIGHSGTARYTYRFNPRTSVFAEHTYQHRDFESPGIDYDVYRPSLGIEHAFTPQTRGRLKAGYFWQIPERGSSTNGFSYDVSLTHLEERISYSLSLQGGPEEDYFTAQNLGFTKSNRATGLITYLPVQRMTLTLSATGGRAEYENSDRKDWLWEIGGGASYQLLKWLSLSLNILHRELDSNVDGANYRENRGILSLTASL